ncbi:MAG TPA: DUF1320 domain-containing protein [Xanthobacteraceae bacterium]|nr:DUF1320 domain-containing protein [Xanthobacteraceae bacterium]
MSYATQQDLVDRFGSAELIQLTDRTNIPPTTIDTVVVDRSLADADALIDGYVGKVYQLPLSPAPAVLTRYAADIARYFLHGKRAEKDGPIERAHREALAWLKDVSRGLVQLDVGGAPVEQTGGGAIRATEPNRVFTRDSLRSM